MSLGLVLVAVAVNVSCFSHEDQRVAHVPHAPSGGVAIHDTEAMETPSINKTEARRQTKTEILEGFERWARASMRCAFSSRSFRSDTCFDQRGAEVACSNPNAHRQETQVREEISSTVANRTDATLACRALDPQQSVPISTPPTSVNVPPKGTQSFSTSATHGTAGDPRAWVVIRCEVALKDAVKLAALAANTAEMSKTPDDVVGVEISYGGNDGEITSYVMFIGDKKFVHDDEEFREVQ
jgi:hypothetical protein